jgi:hypothetical protein
MNGMELGMNSDEEAAVARGAALYKEHYLNTIDNLFDIARAIDILRRRFLGSGVQGAFGSALTQYGFTDRSGDAPMNDALRSHLKDMLANESAVREWWKAVPALRKRDWLSAKAIYTNWKASLKPVDPNVPKKPSPLAQAKATTVTLQKALDDALDEVKKLRDNKKKDAEWNNGEGSHIDLDTVTPDELAPLIIDHWRQKPHVIENFIGNLTSRYGELLRRHKTARVKGQKKPKAEPETQPTTE